MSVEITKEQLLEAIKDSMGRINTIAKRLNIAWHTCDKKIKMYEETKIALQNEIEKNCDEAESVVHDKIYEERDVHTAKWYLQTIGKKRGYVEKVEQDINVNDYTKISEEINKILDDK